MNLSFRIMLLACLVLANPSCQDEPAEEMETQVTIATPSPEVTGGEKIHVSSETKKAIEKEQERLGKKAQEKRKESPLLGKDCDQILAIYREENVKLYETGKRTTLMDSMMLDVIYDSCRQINFRQFEAIDDSLMNVYNK